MAAVSLPLRKAPASVATVPPRAALTGLGLGLLVAALAWVLAPAALGPLHPAVLVLVLLGAVGAVLMVHPWAELTAVGPGPTTPDERGVRRRLVVLAMRSRLDGARGLEQELVRAGEALEVQGLVVLAAGGTPLELETTLRRGAAERAERDRGPERAWRTAGQGALNSGTLITLVAMVQALSSAPTALTPPMLAGCLSAVCYGLALGHLVAYPRAQQLRAAAAAAARVRDLWIEGLVAIASGVHPRMLAERLGLDDDEFQAPLRRAAA